MKSGAPLLLLLERIFLGKGLAPAPRLLLIGAWIAAISVRIPASFSSLGEDDLWNLVVAVDGSWLAALGWVAEPFPTNHILYTVLSKFLIKLTGHHALEFMYRLPSLLAGALALPMAWWAGFRLGGPRVGAFASALFCLVPAIHYHTVNARGYMLWAFLALWIIALLASPEWSKVRLSFAYLLLAISHGLGPVLLGAFLAAGPLLAPGGPERRLYVRNAVCAIPGLLYGVPLLVHLHGFRKLAGQPEGWTRLDSWMFIPGWFEANLGSHWFTGSSLLPGILLVLGVLALLRHGPAGEPRRPWRAAALLGLGFVLPLAFAIPGEWAGYHRFALGGVPAWILLIAIGAASLHARRSRSAPNAVDDRGPALGALLLAGGLLWGSKVMLYLTVPQVDYLGSLQAVRRDFPEAKALISVSIDYSTGLGVYCRRFGFDQVVASTSDSLQLALQAADGKAAVLWIDEKLGAPPPRGIRPWPPPFLEPIGIWRGTELDLHLFVPRHLEVLEAPGEPGQGLPGHPG